MLVVTLTIVIALPPCLLQCAELVIGMAPMVIDWIRSSASPETMCRDAGVCAANMLQSPAAKPVQVSDTQGTIQQTAGAASTCSRMPS
jgi:hypothetical protein